MEKLPMCRICLAENVHMYVVVNKNLHELYERLTDIPFVTDDSRPLLACSFCCAKLKQCFRLLRKCLEAEELFTQIINGDYEPKPLINQDHLEVPHGFIISPIENISIVEVCQTESIFLKEGLPAVCERQDDILEPKEEYQCDDLELGNLDNSHLDEEDILAQGSESDSEEDVPLMEFKIEEEEEQEASDEKHKAVETKTASNKSPASIQKTDMSFMRTKIVVLYEQNVSIKGIARQLGIARQTVRLWVRRFQETGDVKTRSMGRRTTGVYTDQSERHRDIIKVHTTSPFTSTRYSSQRHGISLSTVRRHLHAANIHSYRPAKKIRLTEEHRRERLQFAQKYINFDWENNIVIFSDEKTFRFACDGQKVLWRISNGRDQPQNVLPNRARGRITLGYWGWMSSMGPGELVEASGRMNSQTYLQILQDVMVPTVRVAYPEGHIYFVQDNCSVHRSRIVMEWFTTQPDITVISRPSKSSDLNPIENMWGQMLLNWDSSEMKSKINLHNEVLRCWELMRGSNAGWTMVTQMRSRLQQIIDSEGDPLRY